MIRNYNLLNFHFLIFILSFAVGRYNGAKPTHVVDDILILLNILTALINLLINSFTNNVLHQIFFLKGIFLNMALYWTIISYSGFNLLELFKVVNLLFKLLNTLHIIQHLVLKIIFKSVLIVDFFFNYLTN
jgi:hypothetical protein